MSAKESALELLALGISASEVASTIGVSESYVSQLLGQEDFGAELEQKRTAAAEADLEYDRKLDRSEESFLDKIEEKSRFANLQQSLQAFKVLNSAKRRKDSRIAAATQNFGVVVNITLPTSIVPQYIQNAQAEIVEVEGQTMVSASPKKLEEILSLRRGASGLASPALPGITRIERAATLADSLENKPVLKRPRSLAGIATATDLSDFL